MNVEGICAMLRIIYMGTPHFAVPALEALIANRAPGILLPDGYEIVTVITRPDKPVGRGKEIVFSPVKQAALAHEIPVWQPGSLKRPETMAALAAARYCRRPSSICRVMARSIFMLHSCPDIAASPPSPRLYCKAMLRQA